jgi:hypothetical protein
MSKQLLNFFFGSLLILLGVLSIKCNKDKVQPITDPSTLGNQLVCKINGNQWKSTEVLYSGFYDYNPAFNRRYLYLHYVGGGQDMNIFINPPYNRTTYILDKNTLNYPATTQPENYVSFEQYNADLTPEKICITGSSDTGRIEFTVLDSMKHIVKGKFSFNGKDQRTGKIVVVTDGYFDFHE